VAQVSLDGAWTEEQAGADLRVRQSVASQPSDLQLLAGQIVALGRARTHILARRHQLPLGALRERGHPARHEHVVGRARLQARVDPAVLPAQIFAVDQLGASQPRPQTRTPQAFDRTAVELVSPLALGQQSARPGVTPLVAGGETAGQPSHCHRDH
jgi:hypothetical protein